MCLGISIFLFSLLSGIGRKNEVLTGISPAQKSKLRSDSLSSIGPFAIFSAAVSILISMTFVAFSSFLLGARQNSHRFGKNDLQYF